MDYMGLCRSVYVYTHSETPTQSHCLLIAAPGGIPKGAVNQNTVKGKSVPSHARGAQRVPGS